MGDASSCAGALLARSASQREKLKGSGATRVLLLIFVEFMYRLRSRLYIYERGNWRSGSVNVLRKLTADYICVE